MYNTNISKVAKFVGMEFIYFISFSLFGAEHKGKE